MKGAVFGLPFLFYGGSAGGGRRWGTEQAEMQPRQVMMGQQRFQSRAGVVAVCRNGTIWRTFRFSVSRGFSARVFCSTPKNKREFARRLSFGRKFARNERVL